jgi:hypothetical protein
MVAFAPPSTYGGCTLTRAADDLEQRSFDLVIPLRQLPGATANWQSR